MWVKKRRGTDEGLAPDNHFCGWLFLEGSSFVSVITELSRGVRGADVGNGSYFWKDSEDAGIVARRDAESQR